MSKWRYHRLKILVIQLTRLGDILCTVPTLAALRRENPEAEIHFLVRKRYQAAASVTQVYDHLWRFDTQRILEPVIAREAPFTESLEELRSFVAELRQERFDRVINLSFSPMSSYLSHLITKDSGLVSGYTRTSDLYLSVRGPGSFYFRSHVGLEHSNRIHVVDLMAWVSGVKLHKSDLYLRSSVSKKRKGVICHLGASSEKKIWPSSSWVRFFQEFLKIYPHEDILIVGSAEERALCENVVLQVSSTRLQSRAGLTTLKEVLLLLEGAALFIGADSAPLHLASLAQCPTLNLSVGDVRFWETGPLTCGSRVLSQKNPEHLISEEVLAHAVDMLEGGSRNEDVALCTGQSGVRYVSHNPRQQQDAWAVIDWMHFGGPKPVFRGDLQSGLRNIIEVSKIALQQIDALEKNPEKSETISILDRLDDVLEVMRKNMMPLAPLIEEYKALKENIPPTSKDEIFHLTRSCYRKLEERAQNLKEARSENESIAVP